ncbi:MAG: oligosaccharide flippase family protein [Flavobacteriales bacterium]|nr:oligosaccharide flippase family protein [Flavobacteriales bacterium]
MKILLEKYLRSGFIRNVFTLAAGSGLAQIISVASNIILAKYFFPPEDFAIYAVFFSWFQPLSIVGALRLEVAIPMPAGDEEAVALTKTAIRVGLLTSFLSLMGVSLWFFISRYFGLNTAQGFYFLLPITVFSGILMQSYNVLSVRWENYRNNATSRVLTNVVIALVSILLGYLSFGPEGLIIGLFSGQFAGAIYMYFSMHHRIRSTSPYQGENLFKKYREFIWINTPHAFVDTLQLTGTVFLLRWLFNDEIVGWFFLSWRILKMPLTFMGTAVYQVFYTRASKAYHTGEDIRPAIRKIYGQMFLLGLPICIVLLIGGPYLFALVFGEEWRGAGELSKIMAIWLFANFIVSPVSCMAMIHQQQGKAFMLAIMELLIRFGSLILGEALGGLEGGFWMMSISSTFLMIFMMYWYISISRPIIQH